MNGPASLASALAAHLTPRERAGRVLVRSATPGLVAAVRAHASEVASDQPVPKPDEGASAAVEAFREVPSEADVVAVQASLRPGAPWLFLDVERGAARRLMRRLRPFFDVDRPEPLVVRARRRRAVDLSPHFESLAPEYWAELPSHIQDAYLRRKLAFLQAHLPKLPRPVGLDLGCGLAQFVRGLKERGARVVGLDPSRASLALAREKGRDDLVAGDSVHLPFASARFDFAYAVNMFHHLKRGEQERALREVHRVLKPGAPFLLLEINVRNPVFRWYMRHVFPRTRRIDRGDEEFIHPDRLPLVPEFRLEQVHYATFAPDFLPSWALRSLVPLERRLERTALGRHAIHYMAVLRRT